MSVYKDEKTNTWKVYYRYTDWQGKVHQTTKRGFQTKREALAWEREQLNKVETDWDMSFESFIDIYTADMKNRIKENTWHTKEHIMRTKILPYFGQRKISDIQPKDIIAWQNEMIKATNKQGKPYSPVYLKTLHNQLSAIFNHAVRFYGLKSNPAQKVGNMGKAKGREMLFWTQDEYAKFSFAVMDKPISFYAFEMLYWCGLREGELLALTPADLDFEKGTVRVNKSYQRIGKRDVITDPKTPKSNRTIKMPQFLAEEMQEYLITAKVLGTGLSVILLLVGVMNFVNTMVVNVNTRRYELAVLESIGMTKRQIKRMLFMEGFYYWGVSLSLAVTIGTAIFILLYMIFSKVAYYAVFSYPFIPLVLVSGLVLLICLIVPIWVYKTDVNLPVVERLRLTE